MKKCVCDFRHYPSVCLSLTVSHLHLHPLFLNCYIYPLAALRLNVFLFGSSGGLSTAVNIERGCFYTENFVVNAGCQTFYVPEKKQKVSTCTKSCKSDNCNNWSTPPGP